MVVDRERGVIPHFGRIVIETSGLADPSPILTTFATDRALGGEELRSCVAVGLGSDRLTDPFGGPPTVPARCDMAGGSSGGAWLLDGSELLDGVTSYGYTADHTHLYSPYFGPQVDAFLHQLP